MPADTTIPALEHEVALPPKAAPGGTARRLLRSRALHVLLATAVLSLALLGAFEAFGGAERIRQEFGYAAAAVLLPLQVVVALTPVPSEIVVLAQGAVYGVALGALLAWLGWLCASWLQLSLFRRVARDLAGVDRTRLPRWLQRLPAHHPAFLIGGRWLPWGGHVVTAIAAAHGVPWWRFTWTVALALIPPALLLAAVANGLISW